MLVCVCLSDILSALPLIEKKIKAAVDYGALKKRLDHLKHLLTINTVTFYRFFFTRSKERKRNNITSATRFKRVALKEQPALICCRTAKWTNTCVSVWCLVQTGLKCWKSTAISSNHRGSHIKICLNKNFEFSQLNEK